MDMKNYMKKQQKNILQRKYYFIYIDNTTKFNNKLQIFIVVFTEKRIELHLNLQRLKLDCNLWANNWKKCREIKINVKIM